VSLVDKLAKKLAARWLKGKIDKARKDGSNVLKFLDGQKRTIVTLLFVVSGFVAMLTGQDVSQWIDLILRSTGYTNYDMIENSKVLATQIVPLAFAIWASIHAAIKFIRERQAGATLPELGTVAGAVKAAVAKGDLVVTNNTVEDPAVLELEGKPVVAKVGDLPVTP
jgi:hypothetical protein